MVCFLGEVWWENCGLSSYKQLQVPYIQNVSVEHISTVAAIWLAGSSGEIAHWRSSPVNKSHSTPCWVQVHELLPYSLYSCSAYYQVWKMKPPLFIGQGFSPEHPHKGPLSFHWIQIKFWNVDGLVFEERRTTEYPRDVSERHGCIASKKYFGIGWRLVQYSHIVRFLPHRVDDTMRMRTLTELWQRRFLGLMGHLVMPM